MIEQHIVPLNDLRKHLEESGCWCVPEEDIRPDSIVYVHNALDKREIFEQNPEFKEN